MKITEVEAIILRQPVVDGAIADGSQDDLIVRIHTDEGITGIGEVDSAPEVVKTVFDAPHSHYIATGLRHVLIGQDPLDIGSEAAVEHLVALVEHEDLQSVERQVALAQVVERPPRGPHDDLGATGQGPRLGDQRPAAVE